MYWSTYSQKCTALIYRWILSGVLKPLSSSINQEAIYIPNTMKTVKKNGHIISWKFYIICITYAIKNVYSFLKPEGEWKMKIDNRRWGENHSSVPPFVFNEKSNNFFFIHLFVAFNIIINLHLNKRQWNIIPILKNTF